MHDSERDSIQQDRDFWERMREGDEQALAVLFRRHYAMLYGYGLKLACEDELVKDCIQEVFAYIWEKRQNLAAVDSVRAYLLVALRRQVLKSLERQQQRQASYQQFDREQPQMSISPEDFWVMAETEKAERRALQKALQEIPLRVREALYLKTFEGLNYREIACIMNISPQVARNYVSEAFHRLRQSLAAQKIA